MHTGACGWWAEFGRRPLAPQAQQLVQVEAAKVQEELANTVVEGFSSDETVRLQRGNASCCGL